MTSMSDLSRVYIETLSDKLYSTRRETDFICGRTNWRFFAPRKTLIAHKITILARRPRGLRAKINLASKEMSVFVVRLKNITWEINGGTNLCFSKPLTRVFQVEIYSLQKTFLIRLLFHILRIKFCIYFKPDAKPWPLPSKSILFVPMFS